MKKLIYTVVLTFHDKIKTDEGIKEIATNIAESLKHTADTSGLAPENPETFTKEIEVAYNGLTQAHIIIY